VSTRIIAGRYALDLPEPARPGATAWRARDGATGGAVVVSLLPAGAAAAAAAATLAAIRHPSLAVVLDHGEDAGVPFVVTVASGAATLRQRLAAGPPLHEADAAALGADLADALAALHGAGLVHGALEAGAVALDEAGGPPRLEDPATAGLATPPGVPADDVRALGVLLREAIGAGPGLDLLAIPGVSPRLAALVQSLAAGDPPAAAVARDALRRIADGAPPPAPPAPPTAVPAAARRGPSRRRLLVGVVAALAGIVAATGAVVGAATFDRADATASSITTIAVAEPEDDLTLPDAEVATTESADAETATTATEEASEPAVTDEAAAADGQPAPLAIELARGFDPAGDEREAEGRTRLAVDGNPLTAWPTEVYKAADLGGKPGVGLVLRLALPSRVTAIRLRAAPTGAVVAAYAARGAEPAEAPPAAWRPLAPSRTLVRETTILRSERRAPVTAVLLWFSSLPEEQQGHGVRVLEVEVIGLPRGA
jgi:hypothetical protein